MSENPETSKTDIRIKSKNSFDEIYKKILKKKLNYFQINQDIIMEVLKDNNNKKSEIKNFSEEISEEKNSQEKIFKISQDRKLLKISEEKNSQEKNSEEKISEIKEIKENKENKNKNIFEQKFFTNNNNNYSYENKSSPTISNSTGDNYFNFMNENENKNFEYYKNLFNPQNIFENYFYQEKLMEKLNSQEKKFVNYNLNNNDGNTFEDEIFKLNFL